MDLYLSLSAGFTIVSFVFFLISISIGTYLLRDLEAIKEEADKAFGFILFSLPAVIHFAFMIPALILSIIAFKNKSKLGLAFLIVNISKAAITLIILAILLIVTA